MSQAVKSNLFLTHASCTIRKMPKKMEKQINKNFEIICDSFLDNKLGIHFGGIKFILFASKHKIKSSGKLNVRYKNIKIRQHSQVKYLGFVSETLSGEPMVSKHWTRLNGNVKFLYLKNKFQTPTLCRMLCNALIKPQFNYADSAWYPNLHEKIKKKIQTAQNKCMCFCLKLVKMHHISSKEFRPMIAHQ